ncbi:MAG: hypothetical protein AMXMBFR6_11680 [Betaproteobacteria bacterium]
MRVRLRGFTLIELLVVLAIIAVLLTIATPRYLDHVTRAREATLRESLLVMRDAIDKYHGDTGEYPRDLKNLVEKRYLRKLPADPITGRDDTWVELAQSDKPGRLYDIRSGAEGQGLDGTAYAEW